MVRHQGIRNVLSAAQIALAISCLGLISACSLAGPAGDSSEQTTGTSLRALEAAGVPHAFATIGMTRGKTALDLTITEQSTGADGIERIVRADSVETLEPLADGAEQSWAFTRLSGTGDLTITVDAGGFNYLTTTSDGIELERPGAVHVQYHHGIWIDAKDSQTVIPARFDRGQIVLTVPANLVPQIITRVGFPVLDPKIVVTPL